ncbi:MAG: 30S ribosomal protein S11 [Patescibacteria group bacterium]|jgi:small subunit ribosomal protein S11
MAKAVKNTTKTKKKVIKSFEHGRIYIQSSFNNTIISFTDQDGNVINWTSAGKEGFKGSRRSTPYAAQVSAKKLYGLFEIHGVRSLDVFVSGVGTGRESAVRALQGMNVEIKSIKDTTPVPHNGCRAKKIRRV